MTLPKSSFFENAYNPILQALVVLGFVIVFILGGRLCNYFKIIESGPLFPWMASASFVLFFAMFNSIFSLSAKDLNNYWSRSIMSFMGLAIVSGFVAYFFSNVSIRDAGSYQWIYLVLTIGYLVFLSMMGFMKRVVEFAQREEWNSPKQRRRK
ncbi:MAG: hypothetical protein AAF990_14125 [Bacteroidota bacterium]